MMFNRAPDGRRRTVCRTKFLIDCFVYLVLSFEIGESTVQFSFNGDLRTGWLFPTF